MKAQDIFGSSPKSVLNKPLFQVRNTTANDVNAGETSSGWNDSTLTETPTNEITGASLVGDIITLPVGEYFIEGFVSGQSGSATLAALRDLSDAVLLQSGTVRFNTNNPDSGIMTMRGRLTVSAPIQIKVSLLTESGDSRGWGRTGNIGQSNIWTDICFWKLDTSIETIVISDPQMTLARPLFQIQGRTPWGTSSSSLVEDIFNDIPVNTVIVNEIPGALQSGDTFTLPAGTYEIDGSFKVAGSGRNGKSWIRKASDGSIVLQGLSSGSTAGTNTGVNFPVNGRIVLTESTELKWTVNISHAAGEYAVPDSSTGVGTPDNIYVNILIRQLDTVARTPVLVNDKLFPLPGSVQVVGNVYGLGYAKTAANEVTVEAGACMDSTNEFPLQHASAQVVSIPAVNGAIYNLFLCDDGFVRVDTDPDGAGLVGYQVRWIGFVKNSGTGTLIEFNQNEDVITFEDNTNEVVITGVQQIAAADFGPVQRMKSIIYTMFNGTEAPTGMYGDVAASLIIDFITVTAATRNAFIEVTANRDYYFACAAGSGWLYANTIKMKR